MNIEIFKTKDGMVSLPVSVDQETVWLNRNQLADLFGRDVKTIGKHVNNALREELKDMDSVVAKFATTAADGKSYQVDHYNLDMILSVGYRVKSGRGIEFRRWANAVLSSYIIQGYARNDLRLSQMSKVLQVFKRSAHLMEADSILGFLEKYTKALDLLDRYDKKTIEKPTGEAVFAEPITYKECETLIQRMRREEGSSLFGNQKDDSLKGIIGGIYQSFDGMDLYPTAEEKAAHLLYFVIKDHAFTDGNKRIGAALFLYFLNKNGMLFRGDEKLVDDKALVALTILTAASHPSEKELIVRLIMNFIATPQNAKED